MVDCGISLYSLGSVSIAPWVTNYSAFGGTLGCVVAMSASISKNFFEWIDLEEVAKANPGRVDIGSIMVNFSGPVLISDSTPFLYLARVSICIPFIAIGILGGVAAADVYLQGVEANDESDNDKAFKDQVSVVAAVSTALIAGFGALYLTRNMPTQPGIYFY